MDPKEQNISAVNLAKPGCSENCITELNKLDTVQLENGELLARCQESQAASSVAFLLSAMARIEAKNMEQCRDIADVRQVLRETLAGSFETELQQACSEQTSLPDSGLSGADQAYSLSLDSAPVPDIQAQLPDQGMDMLSVSNGEYEIEDGLAQDIHNAELMVDAYRLCTSILLKF